MDAEPVRCDWVLDPDCREPAVRVLTWRRGPTDHAYFLCERHVEAACWQMGLPARRQDVREWVVQSVMET